MNKSLSGIKVSSMMINQNPQIGQVNVPMVENWNNVMVYFQLIGTHENKQNVVVNIRHLDNKPQKIVIDELKANEIKNIETEFIGLKNALDGDTLEMWVEGVDQQMKVALRVNMDQNQQLIKQIEDIVGVNRRNSISETVRQSNVKNLDYLLNMYINNHM